MCCQEAKISIIRVCLDSQAILPAVQGSYTDTCYLSKFLLSHTESFSDVTYIVRRQDAKMPAYRFVL